MIMDNKLELSLILIFDVSGSMIEMGKIHLQNNLCRYAYQIQTIDQEKYADYDFSFYQWSQNVVNIDMQNDGGIALSDAEGTSNLSALSDFLLKKLNDTERLRVVVLSDGNFFNSDILSFREKVSSFPDLVIRTIAVGADADLLKLRKISTSNDVHLAEDIASAIDKSVFGSDESMPAPESMAQILQLEPAEPEEDWDA